MEDAGVVKLYEPSPTPCLHVAPAENMVGRIPLMPCHLNGNTTPTIPHRYSKNKASCFPAGCADAAAEDVAGAVVTSTRSTVNPWLWQFGRGKPRIGGLTIKETEEKKDDARKSSDKQRKETRAGRR